MNVSVTISYQGYAFGVNQKSKMVHQTVGTCKYYANETHGYRNLSFIFFFFSGVLISHGNLSSGMSGQCEKIVGMGQVIIKCSYSNSVNEKLQKVKTLYILLKHLFSLEQTGAWIFFFFLTTRYSLFNNACYSSSSKSKLL